VYLLLVISVVKNILQLKNHKHDWYFKNFRAIEDIISSIYTWILIQ
jgi:hypothetical protein